MLVKRMQISIRFQRFKFKLGKKTFVFRVEEKQFQISDAAARRVYDPGSALVHEHHRDISYVDFEHDKPVLK